MKDTYLKQSEKIVDKFEEFVFYSFQRIRPVSFTDESVTAELTSGSIPLVAKELAMFCLRIRDTVALGKICEQSSC